MPLGQNTPHTLSAARYESGLDNSPQCKPQQPRVSPSLARPIVHADDGPLNGNEGFGLGPLTFNGSTHGVAGNGMMELYDVAFTSYHALDGRSLLEMSGAAGAAGAARRHRRQYAGQHAERKHAEEHGARRGQQLWRQRRQSPRQWQQWRLHRR